MPRLNIIVPVYNVEKYLERCLDSILRQTFTDFEVLLIDDGSSDSSRQICDYYVNLDKRFKVIHKENGGLSSARNAGLDMVNAKYIGFVDSDDWIEYDMYDYLISLIVTTDSDVAELRCILTNEPINLNNKYINVSTYEGKEIIREYLYSGITSSNAPFSVCNKIYNKELFDGIRFPLGRVSEDMVTNFKILSRAKRMIKSNKIGYYYFQRDLSITRNGLQTKDFDLLCACEELSSLTSNETYKDIKYLSKVKTARSYFSLLSKVAYYGFADESLDKRQVITQLTNKLRNNYLFLLISPMPLNRKIMMSLLCVNFNFLAYPLKIYRKVFKK